MKLPSWRLAHFQVASNPHPLPFSDNEPSMEDDENQQNPETGDDEILAALEGMEKVINELNIPGREFSISLHQQHIALATQAGLDDQVEAARTMMVQSVTCGDGEFTSSTAQRCRREKGRKMVELTFDLSSFLPPRRLDPSSRIQSCYGRCHKRYRSRRFASASRTIR